MEKWVSGKFGDVWEFSRPGWGGGVKIPGAEGAKKILGFFE